MARFSKVIKDLNIGRQRAIDFLEKKGCPVEDDLNAKLTDEQVALLTTEFAPDKILKKETEKRQAARQEIKERYQAEKEKEKKAAAKEPEMVETVVPEEVKPRFTQVGKIDLDALSGKKKTVAKEEKKPAEETPRVKETPVKKTKAPEPEEEKHAAPIQEEVTETPAPAPVEAAPEAAEEVTAKEAGGEEA